MDQDWLRHDNSTKAGQAPGEPPLVRNRPNCEGRDFALDDLEMGSSAARGPAIAVAVPGCIELDCMQNTQGLCDSFDKPVDAVVKGIASGLIITVENLVAHHCLHIFAPEGGGEGGLRRLAVMYAN